MLRRPVTYLASIASSCAMVGIFSCKQQQQQQRTTIAAAKAGLSASQAHVSVQHGN
jgi:hypothetical protein